MMKRFGLLFLLYLTTLFALELLVVVQAHVIAPFTALLTHTSAWVLQLFDPSVVADGKKLLHMGLGGGVSVEPGCNGVEACLVLFAAILAFPTTWRNRMWGVLIGLVAVQGLNLVRIVSLFWIVLLRPDWFKFAHEYLWEGIIMLDALVVFLVWSQRVSQSTTPDDLTTAPPAAAPA